MVCRVSFECLLKLLNFLLALAGLAMVGYGIYLFVEYKNSSSSILSTSQVAGDRDLADLGRPLLMAVSLSSSILDNLPKAWFIHIFIYWCWSGHLCYILLWVYWNRGPKWVLFNLLTLVILLISAQLGIAAFIFFEKSPEDALIFLLALMVKAANRAVEYDWDKERLYRMLARLRGNDISWCQANKERMILQSQAILQG